MNQYILTGGPGCGKTSALLDLELSHKKYILHEAAESVIRLYQAKGYEKPWTIPGFQTDIWMLNRKRILGIPHYVNEVFHDRYFIDCIAYAKHSKVIDEIPKNYQTYIDITMPVFFFEQLDICETNKVRREDNELAKTMSEMIYDEYQNHGFKIIIVKKAVLQERVDFILDYIEKEKSA